MKYKNFEEFLAMYHCKENHGILDDDLPDAYNGWLVGLGIMEWFKLGDEYAKSILTNPLDIRFKGKKVRGGEWVEGYYVYCLIYPDTQKFHWIFTGVNNFRVTPESVEVL